MHEWFIERAIVGREKYGAAFNRDALSTICLIEKKSHILSRKRQNADSGMGMGAFLAEELDMEMGRRIRRERRSVYDSDQCELNI